MPERTFSGKVFRELAANGAQFTEVDTLDSVLDNMPDGWSVRTFATLSDKVPNEGYYIQACKLSHDAWNRAILLCTCNHAILHQALAVTGEKNSCKHAERLRTVLSI